MENKQNKKNRLAISLGIKKKLIQLNSMNPGAKFEVCLYDLTVLERLNDSKHTSLSNDSSVFCINP